MLNLLLFVLCCFGFTQIIVYGKVLENIRPKEYFWNCPMCVGFHVGWFVYLLFLCANVSLFSSVWIGMIVFSGISSGTSYVLCSIFNDDGVKIFSKREIIYLHTNKNNITKKGGDANVSH